MPTPSDNTLQLTPTPFAEDISARTTCPPEVERVSSWRTSSEEQIANAHGAGDGAVSTTNAAAQSAPSRPDGGVGDSAAGSLGIETAPGSSNKDMTQTEEDAVIGTLSPSSLTTETKEEQQTPATQSSSVTATSAMSAALRYEFSNVRLFPNHTSSFLRAGSKFVGTQQSDRQVYNVDVEIKHVDMAESYLCGYLRIQGLTEDHPTLTTFFEGEIIGTKHTFQTRHEAWGATEKTDMHHWARFPAWRPLAKQAKRPDFTYKNFAQREHIFMRWKEYFLVPDHRVRTISGASFEGFYYICFNQVEGTVSGIYFHAKSEKYQQLELKHVDDRGCLPAIEFR
ncbi:vacuolar import and degradation protein [Thermoascus aurantiacus ATCC 26904]